jgi:hypothetical protein
MRRLSYSILIIIVGILAGCGCEPSMTTVSPQVEDATILAPSSTLSPTPHPTATLTPTRTPSPTSTLKPTATEETPSINFQIVEQCVTVEDHIPEGFVLDGKLVWYCQHSGCIMEFQNQQAVETPITPNDMDFPYSYTAISPDWTWLAYEVVTVDQYLQAQNVGLRIVSTDGQEMPVSGWEADWQLVGWKDNERLNMGMWRGEDHFVIVYNPRTGEATETLLPPIHNPLLGGLVYGYKPLPAYYDPTYTRVAYVDEGGKFVLWDIETDTLLWKRTARNEEIFGVDWSPDGQQFAVASEVKKDKAELFMVNRDGEERQLTNLSAAYPEMNITIGDLNWSPDGRYIALWLNIRPGEFWDQWRFAVLDVQTGVLVDTCISSGRRHDPLWSPNGKQVAFEGYERKNPDEYDLVVIDFGRNLAIKWPHELGLLGWMK